VFYKQKTTEAGIPALPLFGQPFYAIIAWFLFPAGARWAPGKKSTPVVTGVKAHVHTPLS
jgi:hypothetical protein